MTKKILYVLGAIVVVILGSIGWNMFHADNSLAVPANINSINFTPNTTVGGDTYTIALNGTTVIDTSGNFTFAGNITQSSVTGINTLLGITLTNELIQGVNGFNGPFSTSTTFTAAQVCASTNQRWLNTLATATGTFPSATSTYAACGSPATGAYNGNWVTNDSTNTLNIVAGLGMTFKCMTQAVGTTTLAAGASCTASLVSIPASTTVFSSGFWDNGSSTMDINWGPMYK